MKRIKSEQLLFVQAIILFCFLLSQLSNINRKMIVLSVFYISKYSYFKNKIVFQKIHNNCGVRKRYMYSNTEDSSFIPFQYYQLPYHRNDGFSMHNNCFFGITNTIFSNHVPLGLNDVHIPTLVSCNVIISYSQSLSHISHSVTHYFILCLHKYQD